jgi:hypothetical protein
MDVGWLMERENDDDAGTAIDDAADDAVDAAPFVI